MPDKETREILQTLAEQLPETVLAKLLPGTPPAGVRSVLLRLAGVAPTAEKPRQKSLFTTSAAPSAENPCYLFTDGAARGNPGEAGAGAVLIGPDGGELAVRSMYLGQCTNNVAEYHALIEGLKLAEQCGCRKLHIRLDSELIVRQVQGAYKVKNEHLKPMFEKVRGHLARLEKWDIRHVPRRENARADELANRGIDEKQEMRAGA